jgi:cytochrome c oxidase assembly protein subunit 15
LTFFTVISGAFVAGLDAGMDYNTFPLMEGQLVPETMFDMTPWAVNFFENIATVQFDHRVLAIITFVAIVLLRLRGRNPALSKRSARAVHSLAMMALIQVALGISTLLLFVPVSLAVLHQAGALVLFTLALWTAYELRGLQPQG